MRFLDIPECILEADEFEVYWGMVMALAIAQLHFVGCFRNVLDLPVGSALAYLDLLTDNFDVTTNVVLGVVLVEEIIHDLS